MSSASIEREDIPPANEIMPLDAAAEVGDSPSEAASVSVSTNTHRWVDNLVGSETNDKNASTESLHDDFADRLPPTPPAHSFEDSPVQEVGNDTSYGFIGTSTAREIREVGNDTSYGLIGTSTARDFVKDLCSYSPQIQPQSTPRPIIPSILNSPFAPQAGEESPHSRPGTAKRMTTHSPRNSQNDFSLLQQPSTGFSVDSSGSPMQDPSQQTQKRDFGVIRRPSAIYSKKIVPLLDDINFHSSSVFYESPWEGPRPSGMKAMSVLTPTPPNGQGGG